MTIYPDNMILLVENVKSSSSKRTCHINARYFFVADKIKKGEITVAFGLMTNMLADFFTKPLQGSTFKRMRSIILNMPDTHKSSAEHRSVLEYEKNDYPRVCRNQNTALINMRTLKTRAISQNNGKQD